MVRCSKCNKIITEGYVSFNGENYYCSDECLYKYFTKEEWESLTEYILDKNKEDTGCYWTEFNY